MSMKKKAAAPVVPTVWFNEQAGVIAACQQLRPKLDKNGDMICGTLMPDGEFRVGRGDDILHEPIPGQIELPENDPRVLAYREKVEKRRQESMQAERKKAKES